MGYRSDVFIGIRKQDEVYFTEAYKAALKELSPTLIPCFEKYYEATTLEGVLGGKIYKENNNGKIVIIECVKWYNSFPDVKAVYNTFEKFKAKELPYEIILIGEDSHTDTERFSEENGDKAALLGFEMYVEQYVEVYDVASNESNSTIEAIRLLDKYAMANSTLELATLCDEMAGFCRAIINKRV